MTTRREYDLLNRLRRVEPLSTATNTLGLVFDYQCNQANQRPRGRSTRDGSLPLGPTRGFSAGSKRKLEFKYDWRGRRIKKVSHSAWNGSSYASVVTTKFIYEGWNLLAELDSSNNVIRSYVWGTDLSGTMQGAGGVGGVGGLLLVKESDGTPHFAAYDGNGNVMGLVKGTEGTRTATYEYAPFGQPLRATGSMALANPMRFSTKFTDNETGLLYYGYRYYSQSTGWWVNQDPIGEEGGISIYGFAQNQPTIAINYLGLECYLTLRRYPGGALRIQFNRSENTTFATNIQHPTIDLRLRLLSTSKLVILLTGHATSYVHIGRAPKCSCKSLPGRE